jgi:O-methyltransferase involved in polyketide biosynthesis
VFDYADPTELLSPEMRAAHDKRAAHVATIGEAWKTYFEAEKLRVQLNAVGFNEVEDLGPRQIAARYFPRRAAANPERSGHIVRAAKL